MLALIFKFSGIISIFITWLFVVAPAIRAGIDNKRQTISSVTKKRSIALVVSFGLFLGTFFQVLFLFYLLKKYQLSYLNFGGILFLTSNIATIIVALFPEHKYYKIHSLFAIYYFLINPISLLFIAYSAGRAFLLLLMIVVVILYFFGIVRIIKQEGICAKVQQWAFFILSVLTVFMTVV